MGHGRGTEGQSWGTDHGQAVGGTPDFLAVKRKSQGPENSELC